MLIYAATYTHPFLVTGYTGTGRSGGAVGESRDANARFGSGLSEGTEDMNWKRYWTLTGLVFLLFVTGCSGTADTTTTRASTTTAQGPTTTTTTATSTTEAEPVLMSTALAGFEPRSVVFANVDFNITQAWISNQEPRSYAEDGEPVIDEENFYAYLDITAVNMMSSTQTSGMGVETYKLVVDGREFAADFSMSFLSEVAGIIPPNTGVDTFLAFPVPEDIDLTNAILIIGVPPDRLGELALTGEVPEPIYPVQFELTGSAEGVGPTNGGTIVFTVLDGTLSEDQPHEHANSPTGLRANEDELFFVIHVRAEKISGRGGDVLGGGNGYRLLVDGVPRAEWDSAIHPDGSNESPFAEPGVAADGWVAFLVPIDAAELVLQVGDFEENPGEIPLELPPLS